MDSKSHFISLISEHKGLISKVVFLYADQHEDRKDLRQEIISQAWGSFHSFKGTSKFSTWLYRVAMNVAIGFLRQSEKRKKLGEEPTSFPNTQISGERELLEIILQKLNPIEKSLVLLLIEGYAQPEIAEILGLSEVNTRTKIHRIRKKLKAHGIDQLA